MNNCHRHTLSLIDDIFWQVIFFGGEGGGGVTWGNKNLGGLFRVFLNFNKQVIFLIFQGVKQVPP
jgi:hypothetical protein